PASDNHFLKLNIIAEARQRRGEPFDPLSVRKLSPPASPAEAYANWTLMALRAGNWQTATTYAWRTFRAGIFRPWLWAAIIKRGVYLAAPSGLRNKWDFSRTKAAVEAWRENQ